MTTLTSGNAVGPATDERLVSEKFNYGKDDLKSHVELLFINKSTITMQHANNLLTLDETDF